MPPLCPRLATASEFSFAARMRIAVHCSNIAQRMTIVRLDRHGFTASVADGVDLPLLDLPRAARVLSGGDTLCELRLVARALARSGERSVELTMQPSRVDDDVSFWRALYARRHLYPDIPAGMGYADNRSDPRVDAWRSPETEVETVEPANVDARCHAVFKLLTANEALFFSEWLEFHFAEVAAHARALPCRSHLLDIDRRPTDASVNVTFVYRYGGESLLRATDEICAQMAQEAEQLFGVCLRYELLDAQNGAALRDGHPGSRATESGTRRHWYSSKQ